MGGQGFVPEDGEGALVEGDKESKELRKDHAYEYPAPSAGTKERRLDRPGSTPEGGRAAPERAVKKEK